MGIACDWDISCIGWSCSNRGAGRANGLVMCVSDVFGALVKLIYLGLVHGRLAVDGSGDHGG